jgi:maltose alpha-D-glucosyltransferase/alpha-amylase
MHANGDGIGDFQGLIRRLDYLQGMGVMAVWLIPFQLSPGKDDGYDVAITAGFDPRGYGTIGDFVEFTQDCRQRGMRVLIDLVVNHTSDEHPWFQEARPLSGFWVNVEGEEAGNFTAHFQPWALQSSRPQLNV